MPTGFHCPNPVCRHVFPPNAISGASALNCPRCGTTFQFRSPGSAAAPAAHPTGRPAGPPPGFSGTPSSRPYQAPPPPPAYAGVPADSSSGETFSLGNEPIDGGKYRRRSSGGVWLLLLVFLALGGGVAGIAYYLYTHGSAWLDPGQAGVAEPTNFANSSHVRSKPFNYSFQVPAAPWTADADVMQKLQANLAFHRTEPDGWLALVGKDYKTQEPQDDEMLDDTIGRLRKVFDPLEFEAKGEAHLAGQRALRVLFQGGFNKTMPVKGEALLMTSQGISYAFITWAPDAAAEKLAGEIDELRQRLSLMNYRDNWTGKRIMAVVYPGTTGPFTIQDSRALWKKNADLMKQLNADLALDAPDPSKPEVKTDAATFVVLLQPKRADLKTAASQARASLEKDQKKDFPKTKVEVVKDDAGNLMDKDGPVGNVPGHIVKLHVVNGENRQRFVTQATILAPDQTIVVQGECPWDRRSAWEKSFDQLLATLKVKK